MRRFPNRSMTKRISQESEDEEPVNVIAEILTEPSTGGGEGGILVTRGAGAGLSE